MQAAALEEEIEFDWGTFEAADGIIAEESDSGVEEDWEAMVDRIQFKGSAPDVNFRAPSEVPSAYEAGSGFDEMEARDLPAALGAGAELWDVREPEEFSQAHVPGARNVPFGTLEAAATAHQGAGGGKVCLICASGSRSAQAQVRVSKVFGLPEVFNVKGGLMAWEAQGGKIEATG